MPLGLMPRWARALLAFLALPGIVAFAVPALLLWSESGHLIATSQPGAVTDALLAMLGDTRPHGRQVPHLRGGGVWQYWA